MSSVRPKQPHDACERSWCELHRLPTKWRHEAVTQPAGDPHCTVRLRCADELQQLLDSADVLLRAENVELREVVKAWERLAKELGIGAPPVEPGKPGART